MGFSGQPRTAKLSGIQQPDSGSLISAHGLRKAGWGELLRLALGWRRRFRVEGNSMLPLLKPNDEVLITTTGNVSLKQGDIVVARHPRETDFILIKQVNSILEDGQIELVGLNQEASTDSREFGSVNHSNILGKVTSIFSN
jgi:nickel-type superoxide dismutase maturation protease